MNLKIEKDIESVSSYIDILESKNKNLAAKVRKLEAERDDILKKLDENLMDFGRAIIEVSKDSIDKKDIASFLMLLEDFQNENKKIMGDII